MKPIVLAVIVTASFSANALAGPEHEHPAPKLSPTFQSLKRLAGTWESTTPMEGATQPMKVTYQLTSGGSALVETLMPGTAEEMITVYANNGDQVTLTHFCMLGNQPQMKLIKAEANRFQFELDGTKGIADKNAEHMHALTLTLDGDRLKHEWVNFKNNQKSGLTAFEFTRTD